MGVLNIASLAGVGYLAYANWTQPRWDRRVVTGMVLGDLCREEVTLIVLRAGVTAGLAALFVPQGIFATEEYEVRTQVESLLNCTDPFEQQRK